MLIIMSSNTKRKALDILVSPYKMQIIDSLAKSDSALSKEDLKQKMQKENMATDTVNVEDYLETLKKLNVIEASVNNRYSLSSTGKQVYKSIKKAIGEISIK
jgi:predicted transcriptional regulator